MLGLEEQTPTVLSLQTKFALGHLFHHAQLILKAPRDILFLHKSLQTTTNGYIPHINKCPTYAVKEVTHV